MAGLVDAAVDHDGQALRAVLLAIAIAACLADMQPSSFPTQGRLSGRLCAWRTTAIAPVTSSEQIAIALLGEPLLHSIGRMLMA